MAKEFTVLVSSTNEMTVNEIGELLNLIETRGIVIEEIHPKEWHGDGDECIGIHCGNPEHGWDNAGHQGAG